MSRHPDTSRKKRPIPSATGPAEAAGARAWINRDSLIHAAINPTCRACDQAAIWPFAGQGSRRAAQTTNSPTAARRLARGETGSQRFPPTASAAYGCHEGRHHRQLRLGQDDPSPHTRGGQDQRLEFLLAWTADYYVRDGLLSHRTHPALFDDYRTPPTGHPALRH
jgi:hypothetical protein